MSDDHLHDTEVVLIRFLAEGEPPPAEWLAHARGCDACRAAVASTERLFQLLAEMGEPPDDGEGDVSAMAAAVAGAAAARFRRRLRARLIASLLLAGALAVVFWRAAAPYKHQLGVTLMLTFAVASPGILAFMQLRSSSGRPRRLYKRLARKVFSGVCRGLSEAYGIPVWIPRLLFLALTALPYRGVFPALKYVAPAIYLVLDLVLPIRPEDHERLLRFRIRRWWRGLRGRRA
jgi:phage shock protein PspC (stress-responsive transcriptional regulator)